MAPVPHPSIPQLCGDWVYSEASNVHIVKDRECFATYTTYPATIRLSDATVLDVLGFGNVPLALRKTPSKNKKAPKEDTIKFRNVLHVPDAPYNIVGRSLATFCRVDLAWGRNEGKANGCVTNRNGRVRRAYFLPLSGVNAGVRLLKLGAPSAGLCFLPSRIADGTVSADVFVHRTSKEKSVFIRDLIRLKKKAKKDKRRHLLGGASGLVDRDRPPAKMAADCGHGRGKVVKKPKPERLLGMGKSPRTDDAAKKKPEQETGALEKALQSLRLQQQRPFSKAEATEPVLTTTDENSPAPPAVDAKQNRSSPEMVELETALQNLRLKQQQQQPQDPSPQKPDLSTPSLQLQQNPYPYSIHNNNKPAGQVSSKAPHDGPEEEDCPLTRKESAYLKRCWGNEFTFLRLYGLSVYKEDDRTEGRRLLRGFMREDADLNEWSDIDYDEEFLDRDDVYDDDDDDGEVVVFLGRSKKGGGGQNGL